MHKALKSFQKEKKTNGRAIDLGAGTGRDTLYLLNEGWQVLAMDAERHAINIILDRVNEDQRSRLEVLAASFAEAELPKNVDLINASYSLPFCPPEKFPRCWQNIKDSIAVGGRFAGQFFGEEDESPGTEITHNYYEVLELFQGQFSIESIVSEKKVVNSKGKSELWQIYHVVAKKT